MSSLREARYSFSIGGELDIRFDSGTPFVGKFFADVEVTRVSVFCDSYQSMLADVNIKKIYVPDESQVKFEELLELHEYIEKLVTERAHEERRQEVTIGVPTQPTHLHA